MSKRESYLSRLNKIVRDFDPLVWAEQDSSCLLCHKSLSMDHGCDWPDDPRLRLCWSCLSNFCAELLASRGSFFQDKLQAMIAKMNERKLEKISTMLDKAGVPEWVESIASKGVPSNSQISRLQWYLDRRKDVAPVEVDQKLQREMKQAMIDAEEFVQDHKPDCLKPDGACCCPMEKRLKPLPQGHWRHSEGMIFCGTLRIAKADFDTDPSQEFRDRVFDEICAQMNFQS